MFENEYKMDIRRYQRWTTPIFYKVLELLALAVHLPAFHRGRDHIL